MSLWPLPPGARLRLRSDFGGQLPLGFEPVFVLVPRATPPRLKDLIRPNTHLPPEGAERDGGLEMSSDSCLVLLLMKGRRAPQGAGGKSRQRNTTELTLLGHPKSLPPSGP